MTKTVTDESFDDLITATDVVVVDFWAPWCGPCRVLGPTIDKVANENKDITVVKVNVDDQQDLAIKYQIRNIPTVLFFKNGEVATKLIGVNTQEKMEEVINDLK